jgi:hypothetical protein
VFGAAKRGGIYGAGDEKRGAGGEKCGTGGEKCGTGAEICGATTDCASAQGIKAGRIKLTAPNGSSRMKKTQYGTQGSNLASRAFEWADECVDVAPIARLDMAGSSRYFG